MVDYTPLYDHGIGHLQKLEHPQGKFGSKQIRLGLKQL